LTKKEKMIGWLIGAGIASVTMFIFFRVLILSIVLGIAGGFIALPFYRKALLKKRKRILLLQFSEMLSSLANSFSSGCNIYEAYTEVYHDMCQQFLPSAMISKEIETIVLGLQNNITIDVLLKDFANRSNLLDIENFVSTFSVAVRLGGDLKKVITQTRNLIGAKIDISMDIEVSIAEKKGELNMLMVMPLVVVMMISMLGSHEVVANTPVNIIVKVIAILLFGSAYWLGQRIINIKF